MQPGLEQTLRSLPVTTAKPNGDKVLSAPSGHGRSSRADVFAHKNEPWREGARAKFCSALPRVARRDIADFKRIDDAGDAQNVRLTQVALLPRHVGHYFENWLFTATQRMEFLNICWETQLCT